MRLIVDALREFSKLAEDKQPTYLAKTGAYLTTNSATFPDCPNPGASVTIMSGKLLTLLAAKDTSELAKDDYDNYLALCIKAMDANYDYIDLIAQGDGNIVALAGVNGTSTKTASTGNPLAPENLKYVFSNDAGQIIISQSSDKLAYGRVIVSYSDTKISVVKSGNTQLKITNADGSTIFVDVATSHKTTIENQLKGTEINSVVANFNPNGISPIASPDPVIIPR